MSLSKHLRRLLLNPLQHLVPYFCHGGGKFLVLQTIRLTQNPLYTQLLNRISFKTWLQMMLRMMIGLFNRLPLDDEELFVLQTQAALEHEVLFMRSTAKAEHVIEVS